MLRRLSILQGCQDVQLFLNVIYNLAAKELPELTDCSLFQKYLILLIKLQLNVGDLDLAYRFGISQARVSRYIYKWVDIRAEMDSSFYYPDILNKIFPDILRIVTSSLAIKALYILL